MPDPTGKISRTAASTTIPATITTSQGPSTTGEAFTYATSRIVRTTVAAGLIILIIAAILLFFKISEWIRYWQRLNRQEELNRALQAEQRANAYEVAAWADSPGKAPVDAGRERRRKAWGLFGRRDRTGPTRGGQRRIMKNAFEVDEWEGFAVTE